MASWKEGPQVCWPLWTLLSPPAKVPGLHDARKAMADIFSPWRIRNLEIPNRIVRSATWDGLAQPDGAPGFDSINILADLAEGGVGLVMAGSAFVRADGRGSPGQTGAHINAMVGPLTRISEAVHRAHGLTGLQITHAGALSDPELNGTGRVIGPSADVGPAPGKAVSQIGRDEIPHLVEDFAMAAARARVAGFDLVQLHACHGYLISQFASPLFNQRQDQFGGSLENRARFGLMVLKAMRQAVGPAFPICVKLNASDHAAGGLSLPEGIELARLYEKAGADAFEISGGVPQSGSRGTIRPLKGPGEEGYFLEQARLIKQAVGVPVFPVGGWRQRGRIESALQSVDAVAMCRPLVREPDLVTKWRDGADDRAACTSCNACLKAAREGDLRCLELEKRSPNSPA